MKRSSPSNSAVRVFPRALPFTQSTEINQIQQSANCWSQTAKRMRLCTCPIYRDQVAVNDPEQQQQQPTPPIATPSNCQLEAVDRNPNPFSKASTTSDAQSTSSQSSSTDKTRQSPLEGGVEDHWTWNAHARSQEVSLYGPHQRTVLFHPGWSNGTAGIRGAKRLNDTVTYWEIEVSHRLFGTSLMFGIGTNQAPLYEGSFVNLIGKDEHSWGLSHKGMRWHGGRCEQFCAPFAENRPVVVGLLFDGFEGTLSYFKNGQPLGVAFRDLHIIDTDLYPMISSTAARTEMCLGVRRRKFLNLQDRCLSIVVDKFYNNYGQSGGCAKHAVEQLPVPDAIKLRIIELLPKS